MSEQQPITPVIPVTPRPSSAVVVARELPAGGFEVFMVRRHIRSEFVPDAFVFPGGSVKPQDAEAERTPGLCVPVADESGATTLGAGFRVAALRECFEEAGVLLARRDGTVPRPPSRRHIPQGKRLGRAAGSEFGRGAGSEFGRGAASEPGERSGRLSERSGRLAGVSTRLSGQRALPYIAIPPADVPRFASYRDALFADQTTLAEITARERLTLATDDLLHWAHWITPEAMPKRFTTHFFLAPMPPGQEAAHDQIETSDGVWITPAAALSGFERGTFPIVFATIHQLRELAALDSLAAAHDRYAHTTPRSIMPRIVRRDGHDVILHPDDE